VRLMGSETAEMAFLDPPYNVPIDGNVGNHGRTKHREFMHASGEMNSPSLTWMAQFSDPEFQRRLAMLPKRRRH
jgi:hypothetical protein